MNVAELITLLEDEDPTTEVCVFNDEFASYDEAYDVERTTESRRDPQDGRRRIHVPIVVIR